MRSAQEMLFARYDDPILQLLYELHQNPFNSTSTTLSLPLIRHDLLGGARETDLVLIAEERPLKPWQAERNVTAQKHRAQFLAAIRATDPYLLLCGFYYHGSWRGLCFQDGFHGWRLILEELARRATVEPCGDCRGTGLRHEVVENCRPSEPPGKRLQVKVCHCNPAMQLRRMREELRQLDTKVRHLEARVDGLCEASEYLLALQGITLGDLTVVDKQSQTVERFLSPRMAFFHAQARDSRVFISPPSQEYPPHIVKAN